MSQEKLSLPIVQSEPSHVFTGQELAQCGAGTCCQCGRCCFLYKVFVPASPEHLGYDPIRRNQPLFREKFENTLCPNVSWNKDGHAECLCHSAKGTARILDDCKEYAPNAFNYRDVKDMAAEFLKTASTPEELVVRDDWKRRGLFSDVVSAD